VADIKRRRDRETHEEIQQALGGASNYRFDSSSEEPVHERRCDYRSHSGFKEGLPKGPGSGMRMLTYFINRGGRNLTDSRRRELEKAKKLLSQRIQKKKQSTKAA